MLLLLAALAAASPAEEAAALLSGAGCTACHSLDGTARVGPTLLGLEATATDLTDPNAEIAEGFPPGLMPPRPPGPDVDALVEAIAALPQERGEERPAFWLLLVGSTLLFVGGHLIPSETAVRRRLVARLGESGFQGAYSLLASVALGGMIWGWIGAPHVDLWPQTPWSRWVPLVVMPPALVLIIAGYTTKNPGSAGQLGALSAGPRGIVRITRHPALLGQALWALAHLPPNGDLSSLILFGSLALLCFAGMWHIDRRRQAELGAAWDGFAAHTSVVPFAANLRGASLPSLSELGAWRVVAGLATFGLWLWLHPLLIGTSPLPIGW